MAAVGGPQDDEFLSVATPIKRRHTAEDTPRPIGSRPSRAIDVCQPESLAKGLLLKGGGGEAAAALAISTCIIIVVVQ